MAAQARAIINALAKVGIAALIDEATGSPILKQGLWPRKAA
jgi:hypothetical protein